MTELGMIRTSNISFTNKSQEAMSQAKSVVDKVAQQIYSGKKADSYSELVNESSIEGLLSEKELRDAIDSKISTNKLVLGKLNMMESIFMGFSELLGDSMNICQKANDPSVTSAVDLSVLARDKLQQIKLFLNQSYNGQRLFAGAKTDITDVVDDIVNVSNIISGVVTANYYNGDDFKLNSEIARGRVLQYGVTAGDQVFQNLIAAHHYMMNGDAVTASSMLQQANKDIMGLVTAVGTCNKSVEDQINFDEKLLVDIDTRVSELEDMDAMEAFVNFQESILMVEIAYQVTNRVKELSIINYIR